MKVGIVGCGIVGSSTVEILKNHHELYLYDKYKQGEVGGVKLIDDLEIVVCNAEVVFISVPTPMKISGEIDLSAINDTVAEISDLHLMGSPDKSKVICIRSTAVSGTTDSLELKFGRKNLKFAFQPEFLTEANYIEDARHPDRIVIGANKQETALTIKKIYEEAGFTEKTIVYLITDLKTSEMIKYACNCFLSTKVSFANEIYNICKHLGIEYETVKKALLMDRRIGKTHLNCPGTDQRFGFSGKCFPKDLNALIYLARERGYNPRLLEEVWETNLKVRKNKDWENIPGATHKKGFEKKGGES